MKKIFLFFIFTFKLFAVYETVYYIPYSSSFCYGTDSSLKGAKFNEDYSGFRYNSSIYGSHFEDLKKVTINSIEFTCLSNQSQSHKKFDNNSGIGHNLLSYFDSDNGSFPESYKNHNLIEYIDLDSSPECLDVPDNNIFNGLEYQGKATDNSSCQSMYNDSGDGNGFQYVNTDLSGECVGFCYYNLPDSTTDTTTTTDTTDTTDNTTTNDGTEVQLSDLIPYLDEVEEKNQNIKDSLDTLNTNLNTRFDSLNSNNTNLNNTILNLDTTLSNLNTKLSNLSSTNTDTTTESEDYTGVTDSLDIDPAIDSDLEGFKTDIESSIESSFASYSNVFGFGGYGSAPAPIVFSMFSKTYTIFDIQNLNPYVDHIRNIFLVVAYIFGLFLVFRGN